MYIRTTMRIGKGESCEDFHKYVCMHAQRYNAYTHQLDGNHQHCLETELPVAGVK